MMNHKHLLAVAFSFAAAAGLSAAAGQPQQQQKQQQQQPVTPWAEGKCVRNALPLTGLFGEVIETFALTSTNALVRQGGATAGFVGAVADAANTVAVQTNYNKALLNAENVLLNCLYRLYDDRMSTVSSAADVADIVANMSEEELNELKSTQNKQYIMLLIDAALRGFSWYKEGDATKTMQNAKVYYFLMFARMVFSGYRHLQLHNAYKGLNDQVVDA